MNAWTYPDLLSYLDRLGEARVQPGLDRISAACERLGNPQFVSPAVHVAGTNGKGSTGAFLRALLAGAGLRVGHYTSPHLMDFAERIWIDGMPIAHEQLAAVGEHVLQTCDDLLLTYFEYATAMAFVAFAQVGVDFAIVETGLGGRLDATNIVQPKVCVLTPIGMDHISLLGGSLREIACEKCGIIKEGVPVVSAPQVGEVMDDIRRVCVERHAPLTVAAPVADNIALGLPGAHQRINAGVALAVLRYALEWGQVPSDAAFTGIRWDLVPFLKNAWWPGRCEWLAHDPPVIFDGAHNVQGAEALAEYIREVRKGREVVCVLGVLRDKDARGIVAALSPVVDRFIAVTPPHPRALPAIDLATIINGCGLYAEPCDSIRQVLTSLHRHIGTSVQLVVITGSLSLYAPAVALLRRP